MRRHAMALIALLALSGCNSANPSFKAGDEVTFRVSSATGDHWICGDEGALGEMGKPPAEFDKVFDQLVADKRIFLEKNNARAVILSTKFFKGTRAAKIRIKEGENPDREAWVLCSGLAPSPKP
jgi:hypothetical protein